jgi:hypothetical protein
MIKLNPLRVALFALLLAGLSAALFVTSQRQKPVIEPVPPTEPSPPSGPVFSGSPLPRNVFARLIELCGNCRIAASNEEWNSTDVHIGDDLPDRRFTSIKHVNDYWEIRYERGGYAMSNYTLLLSNASTPQILPGSTCSSAPHNECRW